jgi:hypothetical protein
MKLSELRSLLEGSPPRDIPRELRDAISPRRHTGRAVLIFVGLFFTAFSLPFLWFFFPWNLVEELRLDFGSPVKELGQVTAVEDPSMTLNDHQVWKLGFSFTPGTSPSIEGSCYHDRNLPVGSSVIVEYLSDRPTVARIEGGRRNAAGYFGIVATVFPAIGILLVFVAWGMGNRVDRLLIHGEATQGRIHALSRSVGAPSPIDIDSRSSAERSPSVVSDEHEEEEEGKLDSRRDDTFRDDDPELVARGTPATLLPRRERVRFRYFAEGEEIDTEEWVGPLEFELAERLESEGRPLTILYDPRNSQRRLVVDFLLARAAGRSSNEPG